MGRAGIVAKYRHVCRRKGCGYAEKALEDSERRCPRCRFLLWPRPIVRPIRFHDIRHTTASLALMAGASLPAVQKLLRHADPRITMETYGHLTGSFVRDELERLKFASAAPSSTDPASLAASLLHEGRTTPLPAASQIRKSPDDRDVEVARDTGIEPVAYGSGVSRRTAQTLSTLHNRS
jgi:hypothetical protein